MADAEAQHIAPMSDGKYALQFSDQTVRANFVKKVFMLVTVMILILTVCCSLSFAIPNFNKVLGSTAGGIVVLGAAIAFISLSCVISCCQDVRRTFPANLIILFLFTIAAGVMVMVITSQYRIESIALALAMTTATCSAVVVFAATVKKDLTSYIGIAFVLCFCLIFFGLFGGFAAIYWNVQAFRIIYAGLGALLSMFYLAIKVQLIMGGKQYELDPEEYVFAAMTVFLDILNIFLFFLRLVGR